MRRFIFLVVLSICVALATPAAVFAATFTYEPPGDLVSGSGNGRVDYKVYLPGMRFPVEKAPAYANSQVWGVGGLYVSRMYHPPPLAGSGQNWATRYPISR